MMLKVNSMQTNLFGIFLCHHYILMLGMAILAGIIAVMSRINCTSGESCHKIQTFPGSVSHRPLVHVF